MLNRKMGLLQRSLRKMLALVLALVLLSATGLMPVASAATDADIETMKNSSVRVLITQGGRLLGKGSGFVIDDGKHIVTNYHVIEAVEKQGAQAWVALGRGRDLLRALEIRATSQANDIAVLSVDQKLAKPSVKLVRREDIKAAEQVIAVGDGNVMRFVQIFFDRPPFVFVGQDHPDRPVRLVILNLPILRGEMDYHFENTVTHCSTHPESVHFPAPGSE